VSIAVRSPDDRMILPRSGARCRRSGWDPHSETVACSGCAIEVCGDGWVVCVPERDFVQGVIWLACGGLTEETDGYPIEANAAYDGPPDEPLGPE
jgi:hypothetical protein